MQNWYMFLIEYLFQLRQNLIGCVLKLRRWEPVNSCRNEQKLKKEVEAKERNSAIQNRWSYPKLGKSILYNQWFLQCFQYCETKKRNVGSFIVGIG